MKLNLSAGVLSTLFALLGACSTPGDAPSAASSGTSLAPFPYTPAEIRSANPPGTEMVYRLETVGAEPTYVTTRFVSGDDLKTMLESRRHTREGETIGEAQREESTWTELQRHASFPAAATLRTEERRETPAGTYDCWLYTIRGEEEGIPWVKRLWFAKDKPGSPVYFEEEHGGQRMMSMTLLDFKRPAE